MITVQLGGPLKDICGGAHTVTVDQATNVLDLFRQIDQQFPGWWETMIRGDAVRRFANVYVDGVNIRESGGAASSLRENSAVEVQFAVSGG